MGMAYGPMGTRLSRLRQMPGSRMPSMIPPDDDDMPPGQGDLGEETMAGEQVPQDPRMISGPGPVGARIMQVHSPAEAKSQRGYGIPQLDQPGLPSMRSPQHMGDTSDIHTAQHQSIARGLQQRRWMLEQKIAAEHARVTQILKSAKAGQLSQDELAKLQARQAQLGAIMGQREPEPEIP